jgi:hypothetical protein
MLQFQGEEDSANSLHNPHEFLWSGLAASENVARRDVGGPGELAGGGPRGDNKQLNGEWFAGTFSVAGGGECRFIRLVIIGRNHFRNDCLLFSAWEIFGSLIE